MIYKLGEARQLDGEDLSLLEVFSQISHAGWPFILTALALVVANLGTEAWKWRTLVKEYYPNLTYFTSFKAVLSGLAAGILTPNRIGDYAGRVLYLEEGNRVEAIVLTFLDRICQMFITLLMGSMVLLYWLFRFREEVLSGIFKSETALYGFGAVLLLMLTAIVLFLLFPDKGIKTLKRFNIKLTWLEKAENALISTNRKMVLKILGLSGLRYAVFSLQYYLLLLAFGYTESIGLAFALTTTIFLVKSVIPFVGFTELGVREAIAINLMGMFGISALTAFSATLILYLINIILPTLAGAGFIYGIKLNFTAKK